MGLFDEKFNLRLINEEQASKNPDLKVHKINGSVPSEWPHRVPLLSGALLISENGHVVYDDFNNHIKHPLKGQTLENGIITYTLFDGVNESPELRAKIHLEGDTTVAVLLGPIYRGQHQASEAPGPTEISEQVESPRGNVIASENSKKIYVNKNASGANDGSSLANAFTTIQAAVSTAGPGDVILVKGGVYRESIQLNSNGNENSPIVLSRYGAERPVISGGEVLSNWTPCTSQLDALGSDKWANCYKAYLPPEHFFNKTGTDETSQNGINLALRQDQTPLYLPIRGAGFTSRERAFNRKNDAWYFKAQNATSSTVTDVANLSKYSSYSELENAYLCSHFNTGNNVTIKKVTGFNNSTKTITHVNHGRDSSGAYAILNCGSDIEFPGQWAFKDSLEADGRRKIVVYPLGNKNLANGDAEIEYCNRTYGLSIRDCDWWIIYGIDAEMQAGGIQRNATGFGSTSHNGSLNEGIIFQECRARHIGSVNSWGAGFTIEGAKTCSILNCSVEHVECQGISIIPGAVPGIRAENIRVSQNFVTRTHVSGIRPHSISNSIIDFNIVTNIESSHANGMSIYGPSGRTSDKVLIFGNIIRTNQGIGFTHQDSGRLYFLFNDVQCPLNESAGHRGIENNSRRAASVNGDIILLNNTAGPAPEIDLTESSSGMVTGKTENQTHHAVNNVSHGNLGYEISLPTGTSIKGIYTHNVLCGTVNGQTINSSPMSIDPNTVLEKNISNVFENYKTEDYRAKAGGVLDNTGDQAIALRTIVSKAFPDFNIDRDCLGNPIDWSAAPIGAYLPKKID